jgi:hypothetical protein
MLHSFKRRYQDLDTEPHSPLRNPVSLFREQWSPPSKRLKPDEAQPQHTLYEHIVKTSDYLDPRRPIKRTYTCLTQEFQSQRKQLELLVSDNNTSPLKKRLGLGDTPLEDQSAQEDCEDAVAAAFVRKYFSAEVCVLD